MNTNLKIIAIVLKRQRMMIDKINANVTVDPRLSYYWMIVFMIKVG